MIFGGLDEKGSTCNKVPSLFSFSGRRIAMNKYMYEGPVMEFDRCIQNNWKGETVAASETKARSNLSYQWKKKNNRIAGVRITLPGKLRKII